jgi:hypothetical protein
MKSQLLLTDDDIRTAIAAWLVSTKAIDGNNLESVKGRIALHIEGAKQLPGPLYAVVTVKSD